MRTELFSYDLPSEYIAQQPAEPRDASRLMVLHRASGQIEHSYFRSIGQFLSAGDLLIANDSRVIPARLFARKQTGGRVEILLLHRIDATGLRWRCLLRGRNIHAGARLAVEMDGLQQMAGRHQPEVIVEDDAGGSVRTVRFEQDVMSLLEKVGEIPLPPYITDYVGDRDRYQTVYSEQEGSVAAPTAGLHFTPELLHQLRRQGVGFDRVTLHVGLDTFRPVTAKHIEDHEIHSEWAELSAEVAKRINQTSLQGSKIIAVGTTSARTLEWSATGAQGIDTYDTTSCPWQRTAAFAGNVDLYIRPGYRYRAVDALLTNFHLPRSSLLMMVSAFVAQKYADQPDQGREILLHAYGCAVQEGYRFYSFGDAMLIL